MSLDGLPVQALVELLPELDDIRHDLGKYVCFETRFVGLDAADDDLRTALRSDLLATRRRGDDTETAWALWLRLRPQAIDQDVDLLAIDQAVAQLETADLDGDRQALLSAAAAAAVVREATRRLHQRAQARLQAAGIDPHDLDAFDL